MTRLRAWSDSDPRGSKTRLRAWNPRADVVRRVATAYNPISVYSTRKDVPEVPEVETVVRDLRPRLVGRRIVAVRAGRKALRRPWQPKWAARLIGLRIETVRRRGKWIVVELPEERCLVFH